MEIAVEVFEQGQRRSFVRRYQAEQLRVGRGWDNDIIIRDPLVDPAHLLLSTTPDGQLLVEDLQSTNGTRIGRHRVEGSNALDFGEIVHLGHSQIRVHRVDQQVAPALRIGRLDRLVAVFHHPALALGLAALAIWLGIFTGLIGDASADASWSERASQVLRLGSGLFIWAVVWGSVARILRHEGAFWPHLSLVSLLVSLGLGGYLLMDWIAFNSLSLGLVEALSGLLVAAVVFMAILVGMAMTTRVTLRATLATAGSLAFVALSLVYLLPALDEEQPDRDGPRMITSAKRPALLIADSVPADEFLASAEEIFVRLEAAREDLAAEE